jgi:hypothetical protein
MKKLFSSVPTWFYEQAPAILLVLLQAHRAGGFSPATTREQLVTIWISIVASIAGIKLQSISAREAEEFAAAHPNAADLKNNHKVKCHAAKARWSVVAQFAGLASGALSGNPWSYALGLRALLYPAWRRFYRERFPIVFAKPVLAETYQSALAAVARWLKAESWPSALEDPKTAAKRILSAVYVDCSGCSGGGFSGAGTTYSDVCSDCGGQSATWCPSANRKAQ